MASDVVEFQRQTFLTSFEAVKLILPDSLAIEFEQIKKCMEDADEVKRNVWSNPDAFSSLLPLLNDLNIALADCSVYAEQSQKVSEGFSSCHYNPFHQTFSVRNMKQKLKSKKDELAKTVTDFGSSSSSSMALFPTGRYTCFEAITGSQLVGIDEQEKKITDLISNNSYKTIGVYGMAGSGKTALILKVLNSPSVQNQFSPIIWLCLSDIDSREDAEYEVNIVKFILCELGCDVDKWTVINPSKGKLLTHLKSLLMTKKYLIVFDDVWENNKFYYNLGDALPGSDTTVENLLREALPRDHGGKIIITSRQKEVAENMVGETNLICMKPLSGETCRMILEDEIGFTRYAKAIEGFLNGSGYKEIGIFGLISSATTAVVRKALSSPSVREMFQPIIWVPVSLIYLNHEQVNAWDDLTDIRDDVWGNFTEGGDEIMTHMLKQLGRDDELTKNNSSIELREIVRRSLESKKYLIVLTDVVHQNSNFWMGVSSAWPRDGDGAVIVTSKIRALVEFLVGDNLVHVRLPELGSNEGSEVASDPQYVSDDIVDQCVGLPFAAKTLAKIFREKNRWS